MTNAIKIIGVGSSGSHIVNYMFRQGKYDVSFALCNTDKNYLSISPVTEKILIATENLDEIRSLFSNNVKIAFIVTGMGGYTGTTAAPKIANIAKSMGIFTVGIVTIPLLFEGKKRIERALNGIEEMNKNVDTLLAIDNQYLLQIYENLSLSDMFSRSDEILVNLMGVVIEALKSNNDEQYMKQILVDAISTIDFPVLLL